MEVTANGEPLFKKACCNGASKEQTEKVCSNGAGKKRTEMEIFDDVFKILCDDLNAELSMDPSLSDALSWFSKVNNYNVPYGKKNRGMTVVHSYKFLAEDNVTAEKLHLSRILGWCVEWLQAFFLVADDVMDGSVTRRGQPCWYKTKDVDLIAVNDSFYLESAIYVILRKYFSDKQCYVHLLDLFHETTMQTVTGQNLDLITAPVDRVNFAGFSIDRHRTIVKYKTAFYSFYLPVALAMHLMDITDKDLHAKAKTILLKMGEYFQIQDDYLDCFGDPEVIGKIGTDIEDNKCSWLIVQALDRATDAQKRILEENYGKHDPECVSKVKAVYNDLQLQQVYLDYENNSYSELMKLIDSSSGTLPKEMFIAYAKKIYKRQK